MTMSRRSLASLPAILSLGVLVSDSAISEAEAAQPSIDVALRSLYAAKRGVLASLPKKESARDRALKHIEQAIIELEQYMRV